MGISGTSTRALRPAASMVSSFLSSTPCDPTTMSSRWSSGGGASRMTSALPSTWPARMPQTYPPLADFGGPQKRFSITMDVIARPAARSGPARCGSR
jgi:hypothetical protein